MGGAGIGGFPGGSGTGGQWQGVFYTSQNMLRVVYSGHGLDLGFSRRIILIIWKGCRSQSGLDESVNGF